MAVTFIGTLLLMAGVEPNPGPPDKVFSFRYQYLLIEVGTSILRKVFDYQVGPGDFKQYLDNDTAAKQQLLFLINRNKITAEQQQLIPPVDSSPKSSNFDITLLCCLLRNACGLRVYSHTVWINPSPTDKSIEAQIYRLKECRNKLMHSGSVFDSETDLNAKWVELCSILTDLGNFCRMANLQLLIDKANTVDIDEKLKEQFNNMMSAWVEMDRLFDHGLGEVVSKVDQCVEGQERLEQKVDQCVEGQERLGQKFETMVQEQQKRNTQSDNIEQAQRRQKLSDDDEVKKDVQKYLVDLYRRRCKTLPVSPLFKNKDENLLNIYQSPTMNSVKCLGEKSNQKDIKCYEEIFVKSGAAFEEIYIVGDAGVGKTSFCTCMSLLWCYAISKHTLGEKYKKLQEDVEYMSKFGFVFFVSLRDTYHTHVIDMIIEQLFENNQEKYRSIIDNILSEKPTLILMDGLDEWMPIQGAGKPTYELPVRRYSKNIVHLTTSRPYQLESVRLANKDVDHLVEIKGISGVSSYVEDVIKYMNKENTESRNLSDFTSDMKKCKLDDLMCIPIIASHLVVLWFDNEITMTNMPRSLIYANILEMLLKRAEKRGVKIPLSTVSKFEHIPGSLLGLKFLNTHVSLLYNVCHLSFRSLFNQDKKGPNLVFTVDQLEDEPYCFPGAEIEFLCKIGILSKNEVFGCGSVEKLKLSFIHKSYIEFFSALFISSSSDISQLLDERWKSLDYVLRQENLIVLLVGFFAEGGKVLLDNLYQLISDDLSLCRANAIFHYDSDSYTNQIKSLQTLVIKCFKELSRSNVPSISLKLEDFIFDDKSDVDILRQLLLLNTTCVKSVYSVEGKYYDAFDEIKNLHCLHVGYVLSEDVVKFTKCMLSNQSTLHTVCIEGRHIRPPPLLPVLPVRDLHQLTSLSLSRVTIPHDNLCDLVNFLSDNVHLEHIKLFFVSCDKHRDRDSDCTLTLNLHNHTQLTVLDLSYVYILCKNVNNSSLKSVTLGPRSERIVGGYIDIFNCIKSSQLERLFISGDFPTMLDDETMRTLTAAVKTLPCMKSLILLNMNLVGGLELHPCVTPVKIELYRVTMSRQCFHCFIESCVNTKSVIKVGLWWCKITTVDGESHRELSDKEAYEESVKYMSEYLTQIQTITITRKDDDRLDFETTSCQ